MVEILISLTAYQVEVMVQNLFQRQLTINKKAIELA